jgi:hypothetical protein
MKIMVPTSYGGVFRNVDGKILKIVFGYLGTNSNNDVELLILLHGSRISFSQHYHKIIVEGDSHFIIHMLIRIKNGSPPSKVS